jgi:hypothetical protein
MVGWAVWVWFPSVRDVAGFLAEEVRLRRIPSGSLERLRLLVEAASEVEGLFFGDGDGEVACLGFYVVRVGHVYKVFVVVAYYSPSGPYIEAVDVEEWVSVERAKRLAARV